MFNNIIELYRGIFYNITSIYNLHLLNKKSWSTYLYILLINISLLYIPNYLYNINSLFFIWIIPAFIFCYIFSLDKFNDLLIFLKDPEQYINIDLNQTVYFFLISFIYYFIVTCVSYIPYVGKIVGPILLAHSYGYYCLEYSSYYNNLSPLNKLTIIENNTFFFIGYGTFYTLLSLYLSTINLFIFFIVVFPLDIIQMTHLKWIHKVRPLNNVSKFFLIPSYILDLILTYIINRL
uniref:Uncharacterized protein n=1 Tax=viral metagenome TaxID=1070528 RepID=A0A6C0EL00_9ZZZZ